MEYRREIDGLRALAVLPVIFFHAGLHAFSGGFVGVDVFFVISGYLITTIILAELERGRFSIVNFYERRARRILPALFLVMLVCIPCAWFLLQPSEMKDFSQSLVAVSAFASNILFWRESGYFDTAAEAKPLLHTWSLAVEEQYYVIFPLFLMLLWKAGKPRTLIALGIAFAASLALAQQTAYADPSTAFYLLPTRGWELLIGAFTAFYLARFNRRDLGNAVSEIGGWLGVALICYAAFSYSKSTPFPGLYALIPTLGTALIILFASPDTTVGRFVGNRLFVGIGLISYSAYLWHQPLFAFARLYTFNQLDAKLTAALILLSFGLAFLSFKLVETPFRSKDRIGRSGIFLMSILGALFFIALGSAGHIKDGFPGANGSFNDAINDRNYLARISKTNIEGYHKLDADKPTDVLFFGDSHAAQFAPLFSNVENLRSNLGILTSSGCPPIPNLFNDSRPHCADFFNKLNQVLSVEAGISKVLVAACFNCYFTEQSRDDYYYLSGGKKTPLSSEEGRAEALLSMGNFIKALSLKHEVIIIGDNPLSDSFNPAVMLSHKLRGDSAFFKSRFPEFSLQEFEVSPEQVALNDKLRAAAPSMSARYISLADIVCPGGVCKSTDHKGLPVYRDANHMRPAFIREAVWPHLMKHLE